MVGAIFLPVGASFGVRIVLNRLRLISADIHVFLRLDSRAEYPLDRPHHRVGLLLGGGVSALPSRSQVRLPFSFSLIDLSGLTRSVKLPVRLLPTLCGVGARRQRPV